MEKPSSSRETPAPLTSISAGKAVALGHLVVNLPVLVIMLGFAFIGLAFIPKFWLILFVVGFVLAWLWWSFAVPRWRRWALRHGAQPDRLQKLGAMTGLVWPKGSVFEKTEFKVDK